MWNSQLREGEWESTARFTLADIPIRAVRVVGYLEVLSEQRCAVSRSPKHMVSAGASLHVPAHAVDMLRCSQQRQESGRNYWKS
ncbi:hypothetical protein E2C01_010015 [Portunus trituberculatus]|uniref:Uncharacterized protein n=1 Tax=Portunus trituberculatus TaxID=210409 RepID=A0A5B7D791_PORTR|nr:hypothetical protein [Portunus trituberculatus]